MVLLSAVIGTANCCPQAVQTAAAGVLLSHLVTLMALFGILFIHLVGRTSKNFVQEWGLSEKVLSQ
jgi:hypothetical protein